MSSFFSRYFFLSIILILVGLIFSGQSSEDKTIDYILALLSQLFQSTGVALFIGSIFTFILSTEQFVAFIRERLINIVISKDFIANLNQQEQKKLLHMVLKPAKELSSIYSGITDYFNQYIDNSMRLFDTIYRGHMKIDGVVSYNNEKECIQIEYDIDYIVYKTNEAFEPLVLGLEDEKSEHIQTIIRGVGGLEEVLTDEHSKQFPKSLINSHKYAYREE